MEPVTAIILSIVLGWGVTELTNQDTCVIERAAYEQGVEVKVSDTFKQEYCDSLTYKTSEK